jgi:hypothetical protein
MLLLLALGCATVPTGSGSRSTGALALAFGWTDPCALIHLYSQRVARLQACSVRTVELCWAAGLPGL